MRDDQGRWLVGMQQTFGYIPSSAAELAAIGMGLKLCLHLKWNKVKLYTDSKEAIFLLTTDVGVNHPLHKEITEIRLLIASVWDLEIIHADREALKVADLLARNAHGNEEDVLLLPDPRGNCLDLLRQDLANHLECQFD